jgi:hypothetical protein
MSDASSARGAGDAAERDPPGCADGSRGDDLGEHDGRDRLGDAPARSDRDGREAKRHRDGEKERANVVAAAQDQRGAGQAFRRLCEWKQRSEQQRRRKPARVEERLGGGRERDEREPGEDGAARLEGERAPEQAVQPPPVLRGRVAEAVLRDRVLDGQVEQRLEEARGRHDEREEAEVADAENPGRDDRREEPEQRRGVDSESSRRAAPEEPRMHNRRPV